METNGLNALYERLVQRDNSGPGDYLKDGVLMCGKCHTPKQVRKKLPRFEAGRMTTTERLVPIVCRCREEELEHERDLDRQKQFEMWMDNQAHWYGLSGGISKEAVFEADDGRDAGALQTCKRYVEHWAKMRDENIGMLFCGPNGTGKSFHAEMIANALLKMRVPTLVTSFPAILAAMEKFGEKREVVNHLRLFDMVVIDDLGAERDSSFGFEQVFSVIDARYRQKKPLIVTTNLYYNEIETAQEIRYRRCFDRVIEMCPIVITLDKAGRRPEIAQEKKQVAMRILSGH